MTLREQLLWELQQQNESAQEAIKKLISEQETDAFIKSADRGALTGITGSIHENNIERAQYRKEAIQAQNAWVAEMLAQYK